jgi:hypothetical protein
LKITREFLDISLKIFRIYSKVDFYLENNMNEIKNFICPELRGEIEIGESDEDGDCVCACAECSSNGALKIGGTCNSCNICKEKEGK